jgi:class 3 adenylate cyclase
LGGEHVERRLAAILAADVVGSCRLIGIDEEGTLAQLKALRKTLFDPKIIDHRGRIVKNTGDGALVEFSSLVDAVRCAVEIQRGMAEQNIDVRRTNGSNFASAFTSVILSSKTMISLVTASTLRYVSKGSQNRVC